MKSDRRKPKRLRMHFGVGQARSPFGQIVKSQLKRMQNGAARSRNVRVRAAEPRFSVGGLRRGSVHWQVLKERIVPGIAQAS